LVKHIRESKLEDYEGFLLTDNLVVENAFNKGYSSSKLLFDLVLRLKKIELEGRIILHMMHVSRKRIDRIRGRYVVERRHD